MKITVTFTEKEIDFLLQCIISRNMERENLIKILDGDSVLVTNQKDIMKECDRLFALIYQAEILKKK